MSQKTFSFNSMQITIDEHVYDPAEDTFLLLDILPPTLNKKVLELGTGCGIIALECARRGATVIGTDISPTACACSQKNVVQNKSKITGSVELRQGDLFSVLKKEEQFDIILMNPPYLPEESNNNLDSWLSTAIESGKNGLEVLIRFITGCSQHLRSGGVVYMVVSSLADIDRLNTHILKNRFHYEVEKRLAFEDEQLSIYKITKKPMEINKDG